MSGRGLPVRGRGRGFGRGAPPSSSSGWQQYTQQPAAPAYMQGGQGGVPYGQSFGGRGAPQSFQQHPYHQAEASYEYDAYQQGASYSSGPSSYGAVPGYQAQQHGGPSGPNSLASQATAAAFPGNEFMQDAVMKMARDKIGDVSWLSMHRFKYYFQVNNLYVVNKLRIILMPYLHRQWTRERDSADPEGRFLPPGKDVNAPDLYIPLMAFITYILIMGFIMGIGKAFTPEVLGSTATWALIILIMEVFMLRVGFAVIGSSASVVAPPILDLVAYSSYKFVILVIDLIVWVLSYHNSTMYWVISIITGVSMTVFMARTLQRAFVPRVEGGAFGADGSNKSTRQLFLIAVGICQIPLCILLGRTVAR